MTLKEKLSHREELYGIPMALFVVKAGRVVDTYYGEYVESAARGMLICSTWDVIDFYEFNGVAIATFK